MARELLARAGPQARLLLCGYSYGSVVAAGSAKELEDVRVAAERQGAENTLNTTTLVWLLESGLRSASCGKTLRTPSNALERLKDKTPRDTPCTSAWPRAQRFVGVCFVYCDLGRGVPPAL